MIHAMDDLIRHLEKVRAQTFSIVYQAQRDSDSRVKASLALMQKSAAMIKETERLVSEQKPPLHRTKDGRTVPQDDHEHHRLEAITR